MTNVQTQKKNSLELLTPTVQPLVADSPQRSSRSRLVRLREGSQCTEVPSTRSSRNCLISLGYGIIGNGWFSEKYNDQYFKISMHIT